MAALRAGKHVFCEKTLGTTLEEAAALVDTAESRGLRLGVAPDTILGAGLQKARALIDAGAIGRPLMATASILYHGADDWHPNPAFFYRAPGGGPVHDVGPYFLAALMALLGPIEQVYATGFRGFDTRTFTAEGPQKGMTFPVEVMTSVLALVTFRLGVQATLTTSWDVWRNSQPDLEIHGTLGSLSLPHPNWHGGPLKFARPRGEWETVPLDDEPLNRLNWPPEKPLHANYRGIGIAEMVDAMERGQPHPHVGGTWRACRRSRRCDRRFGAQRRAHFPRAHAAASGALRRRRRRPPAEGLTRPAPTAPGSLIERRPLPLRGLAASHIAIQDVLVRCARSGLGVHRRSKDGRSFGRPLAAPASRVAPSGSSPGVANLDPSARLRLLVFMIFG